MKTSRKMKTRLLLMGFGTVTMALTSGCNKENALNPTGNCYGGNWAEQYTDELQAWSNAATAYSEDPSQANCTDYKNAAKDYLDALEDIYQCVPTANRAQINQAINEAKAEVDEEGCD